MKTYYRLFIILIITSCVKNDGFDHPTASCDNISVATIDVQEIFNKATAIATKYTNDDYIEAYVVSSDQQGNFFKTMSLQSLDGSLGFSIAIDQTDTYTIYNPGSKVIIKLKNLYTEVDNDALEIGDLFIDNFNNVTVGRIAYPTFEQVLTKSCEVIDENNLVHSISITDISDSYLNTLVEFAKVQFTDEALHVTFHTTENNDDRFATNHAIQDTSGNTLFFRTSAFAAFSRTEVPSNSGTIRGVLTKFGGEYQLVARSMKDVKLADERFEISLKNTVFFTELADPDNNSGARFIEIYNAEQEPINLNGWTIRRYTNANMTISSSLDLSGHTINAGQAFVIAANATEFETVFGFAPNLAAGSNSPADSNGDDNLALVDSQGTVVDVFGVIGEDGSGTNHEFEDGRALRKAAISIGNQQYTFSEWQLWNDTGDSGTIKAPQNAPVDFTPGVR